MSVALTVGSFDGLHLGHVAVIRALVRRARDSGLPAVVVTFEPHPAELLRPDDAPGLLTSHGEKMQLLASLAVDRVHLLRFTREFAALEPREFVRDCLVARLGCRELVVGEDHRFGRHRAGGLGELRELARELDLGVEVVPRVTVDGARVSSTRVREAVAAGDLRLATRLLGRAYGVFAPVVRGAGRGAGLGFPTVNLTLDARKQMPPEGIYACRAVIGRRVFPAAAHWGGRPTFGEPDRVLEAHLVGEVGDLYGSWMELQFLERLRGIERFDGPQALVQAMTEDVERTSRIAGGSLALQSGDQG